ncbi:MAG: hypothetical protein B7Z80_07645 [Rhodospirillales bacterium 20-64-7]|nr:MAG: hypothetical protein B7Z80_07645 [Rhodospirillales bacterium 20-64-7]HQT79523.1 hypothetical protein [Rhodopila sp.]
MSSSSPYHPNPFMEHVLLALLPHFSLLDRDRTGLPADIVETLQSYGGRTRVEILHAALALAFGMAALDTLAQSVEGDLSPTLRLRYRVCANAMNRAAHGNMTALNRRLACDVPSATAPTVHPADDLTDAQVDAMIQQAKATFDACKNRLANPPPAAAPPRPVKRVRDSALAGIFAEMAATERPAA